MQAFLDELKTRSVVRVAGLYAVGGWAVFQIVNSLFPALDFPRWTVTAFALLFLAGFPVALILAWFTEMTPEGLKVVPKHRRSFGVGRFGWVDWLIAAVVAALLAFSAVQLVDLRRAAAGGLLPLRGGVPDKSVAVLPFASFSAEIADGFFADGLTEELIDSLVQSPELKVAGRTSSFYFKGKNEDLREVGRKLGVAHVVEGSVRRDGPRLRVTAQLIKVADGFHLWSASYDRTMDDALAIQNELADAVADKLKAELTGQALAQPSGRSAEAYRLELVARARLRTQELEDLRAARTLFAELARLEPGNPRAHAGFAQASILLAQNFLALDFDTAHREAQAAIRRALGIDARSAEAWLAKATLERVLSIRVGGGAQSREALDSFRRALALSPKDPEVQTLLANQYLSANAPEKAVVLLRAALTTDPLSRTAQHLLATTLSSLGRYEQARGAFEKVVAFFPEYTSGRVAFAQMLMFQQGKLDEAAVLLDEPRLAQEDPLSVILLASCYANLGLVDAVPAIIARLPADSAAAPIGQALLLQVQGRRADVLALAEREYRRTRDPIWNSVLIAERLMLGDYGGARALLPSAFSKLFADVPDVEGVDEIDVAIAAHVLARTGSPDRADAILQRLLATPLARSGPYGAGAEALVQRGLSLAAAGRTEEAVAAFENAFASGWRMPIEFEYFMPLRDYPFMAEVVRHPRFRALMTRLDADLAAMRARLEARQPVPLA